MSDTENLRRLWEDWRPPAELERSRPRPVRFSGQGKFILVVMLALAAGGLIGGVMLYRKSTSDSQRDRLLAETGVQAEGRITRLWRTSGKNRRCMAAYQFNAEGAIIGRSAAVSCSAWGRLTEGQRVEVQYLPGIPQTSRLEGIERGDRAPVWLPPVMAVVMVGSALLISRRITLERRLLEDGHVAPGVVTKLGIRTDKGRKVHYEFATYSGTAVKGSYGPVRGKDALPVGSPLVILYDRDNPKRSTRYPPGLVKLDY